MWVTLLLLLAAPLLALLLLWLHYQRSLKRAEGIPMLPSTFLLYHLPIFLKNRNRIYDFLVESTERLGGFLAYTAPFQEWKFMCNDTDLLREALKDYGFPTLDRGETFQRNLHELLGDGIFNSTSDLWVQHRKTMSEMFKTRELRHHMLDVFDAHTRELAGVLDDLAKSQEIVDFQDLFGRFTLDCITQIAFGYVMHSVTEGTTEFSQAFNEAQKATENRYANPFWFLFPTALVPSERRLRSSVQMLDDFAEKILREKLSSGQQEQGDILSTYISSVNRSTGEAFSEKLLRDVMMNLTIAGRDTTGQTLQWMFYLLDKHPEVEEKLLQEINSVCHGEMPTFDQMRNEMPYLQAVIDEALRLYPPVPWESLNATRDFTLSNGVTIRKGDSFEWSAYCMGRLAKYFPDRPLEMVPERWFADDAPTKNIPPFIPFNYGPRTCLGIHMAYLELKTCVSYILPRYHLKVQPGFVPIPYPAITMISKNGMMMSVSKRTA